MTKRLPVRIVSLTMLLLSLVPGGALAGERTIGDVAPAVSVRVVTLEPTLATAMQLERAATESPSAAVLSIESAGEQDALRQQIQSSLDGLLQQNQGASCLKLVASVGNPALYQRALSETTIVVSTRAAMRAAGHEADAYFDGKTNTLTLAEDPRNLSSARLEQLSVQYWHELTHKLEDMNGDWGFRKDYNERNTDYMESMQSVFGGLRRFEAAARSGRDVEYLRSLWRLIRGQFTAGAPQNPSYTHPDASQLAELEAWTGYRLPLDEIEQLYKGSHARSGECSVRIPAEVFALQTSCTFPTTPVGDEPDEDDFGFELGRVVYRGWAPTDIGLLGDLLSSVQAQWLEDEDPCAEPPPVTVQQPPPLAPAEPPAPPTPPTARTPPPAPPPAAASACAGDERMTFDPASPKAGEEVALSVTSSKALANISLDGGANLTAVSSGGPPYSWTFKFKPDSAGRRDFTFRAGGQVCTANFVTVGAAATSAPPPTPTPVPAAAAPQYYVFVLNGIGFYIGTEADLKRQSCTFTGGGLCPNNPPTVAGRYSGPFPSVAAAKADLKTKLECRNGYWGAQGQWGSGGTGLSAGGWHWLQNNVGTGDCKSVK